MKYNESGLIKSIQTEPISYNWIDMGDTLRLTPTTITFKLEVVTKPNSKILIRDSEIGWWFVESFNGKYFAHISNNVPSFFEKTKTLDIKDEDIIFVEEYGLEYLLTRLYSIVDELLENSKLLSIEIV